MEKEFSLLGLPPLKTAVAGVTDSLALAKELFPGKRNSLDALCDRLGVDNCGRTLHGALLDAQLLADVYIYMTRGQHALLGDDGQSQQRTGQAPPSASRPALSINCPSCPPVPKSWPPMKKPWPRIDKASGGKTVWRSAQS